MWSMARKLIAKWTPLGNAVAEVVYEAPEMGGQHPNSLLQWRVKRRADTEQLLISLKVIPDYFGGPDGGVRNYIDFKPTEIERLTAGLQLCLAECKRLQDASVVAPMP